MSKENQIELNLIEQLKGLKYIYRPDIIDRKTLEQNFKTKFEELNRVHLTDSEFLKLREAIITSDVFSASKKLRERQYFQREDGTPLHYTLVNIKDWCKNEFEVVSQLRINTENSNQRYDIILLINGLPSNLFYSTGIPVCILVLKKCKKQDDVLFINASEQFEKGKRQNSLSENHLENIVETYKFRTENVRYSRRVTLDEIKTNEYNLNISRYVSTSEDEIQIDLQNVNNKLTEINRSIETNTEIHNEYLKELGLKPI